MAKKSILNWKDYEPYSRSNDKKKALQADYDSLQSRVSASGSAVAEAVHILKEAEARVLIGELTERDINKEREALNAAKATLNADQESLEILVRAVDILDEAMAQHKESALGEVAANLKPKYKHSLAALRLAVMNAVDANNEAKRLWQLGCSQEINFPLLYLAELDLSFYHCKINMWLRALDGFLERM